MYNETEMRGSVVPSRKPLGLSKNRKNIALISNSKFETASVGSIAPAADPSYFNAPAYTDSESDNGYRHVLPDDSDSEDECVFHDVPVKIVHPVKRTDRMDRPTPSQIMSMDERVDLNMVAKLERSSQELKLEMRKKDKELAALKVQVNEANSLNTLESEMDGKNGAKESKIIELAKKVRKLTVSLEREKGRCASLQASIKRLEEEEHARSREELGLPSIKSARSSGEAKGLKERNAYATRKLEEERMVNQTLRAELRKAQKALMLEVGDGADVTKILSNPELGGWKGRAEQIAMLKDKLKESSKKPLSFDRERGSLKRMETTKRLDYEKALLDSEMANHTCKELKSKHDAVNARNSILLNDNKNLKAKMGVILAKSEVDNKLIEALQKKLNQMKLDKNLQQDL